MAQSQDSRPGGEQQTQDRRVPFGADEQQHPSSGSDEFDPDYYQWRSEQMRALDDDYRAWRQERNGSFSDEFTAWRDERVRQHARSGEDDESERAPHDQGNSIVSQEQNENVAERAREEERDK